MSGTGWNYTTLYIQFYSHEWKTGKVWQGGARQVAPSCPVWKVNTAGEGLALLHQVLFCQYYQLVYKSQATIPGEQFLRTTFNWYESSNNVTQIIFWSLCDMFLIICCRREDVYIPFHHSALKMLMHHTLRSLEVEVVLTVSGHQTLVLRFFVGVISVYLGLCSSPS